MNTRAFLTLLVVLALSAWFLAAPVGSAVRLERAGERLCEVDDAAYRDNDDVSGGDDDRWGDADPWDGDPEAPDSGDGTGGGEGEAPVGGSQAKPQPLTPLYRLRLFLTWVFVLGSAT